MHRSSDSIASLAGALAKAQGELVNPEKLLTATISAGRGGGSDRSFRYASLSSGLDIVRKTLGQHEIATVQTTTIDQTAGQVNLTTILAHASGEWIASDWPVCAVADIATPRRMGAALTYARRYALFTLVGIAGEEDLDAPDLTSPAAAIQTLETEKPDVTSNGQLNDSHYRHSRRQTPQAALRHDAKMHRKPAEPVLAPEVSAQMRDRLVAGLDAIASADDAALWAHRSLPAKNRLTEADALNVEEGFRVRLAILTNLPNPSSDIPEAPATSAKPESPNNDSPRSEQDPRSKLPQKRWRSKPLDKPIDKSILALPEPRGVRDRDHVRYVGKQACLVCGRQPSDAHHLRFTQKSALGRKVSDEFTVPLCRGHHREVHRYGDETAWWRRAGINPTTAARTLWLESNPLPGVSDKMPINRQLFAGILDPKMNTAAAITPRLDLDQSRRINEPPIVESS
jgi:hypothetical protein